MVATDYRAIMLALLHGQTYATISARLRCSSKTIRQVRLAAIRASGVSNFGADLLRELHQHHEVKPALNQIRLKWVSSCRWSGPALWMA